MKKYLNLILEGCAFLLGCIVFLTMIGDSVKVSVGGSDASINCYDLVTNKGALFITALVFVCVGLALTIAVAVIDLLKVKLSFKRWLSLVPALFLLIGGVLFFFGVQCFNALTESGDFSFSGLVGLFGGKVSLGYGAILSGIFALLSSCSLVSRSLLIKK